MKKRSGIRRAVAIRARADLDALSTKRLLARLARLRFCEESADVSDLTPQQIGRAYGILFKRTPEWRAAYADLKSILSAREHVARVADRQAASRRPSSGSRSAKIRQR